MLEGICKSSSLKFSSGLRGKCGCKFIRVAVNDQTNLINYYNVIISEKLQADSY